MNPYQSPMTDLGMEGYSATSAIPKFTGNYYIFLAWFSVVSMIIESVSDGLHLDLTFIFMFWLGRSLKRCSNMARCWAIVIFSIITVMFTLGLFVSDFKATFADVSYYKPNPIYYIITVGIWIVFAMPALPLLTKRGKEAFKK